MTPVDAPGDVRDFKRDAAIASAYRQGETLRSIGGHFNISFERVRQVLERMGVRRRSRGKRGFTS